MKEEYKIELNSILWDNLDIENNERPMKAKLQPILEKWVARKLEQDRQEAYNAGRKSALEEVWNNLTIKSEYDLVTPEPIKENVGYNIVITEIQGVINKLKQ